MSLLSPRGDFCYPNVADVANLVIREIGVAVEGDLLDFFSEGFEPTLLNTFPVLFLNLSTFTL